MEDAHTAELSLDEGVENPNAFFAVYDGHNGTFQPFSNIHPRFSYCNVGGSVAKFAGINVHKRLVTEEAYREKRYEEALKRAFLGTDEDLLARQFHIFLPVGFPTSELQTFIEPLDTRSAGCTAVAALVTADGKIYVVCDIFSTQRRQAPTPPLYQANAGDSRSVISVKGKVKPLSFDHRPSKKSEFHSCGS
jgi:protein phosphatase PTC2/3